MEKLDLLIEEGLKKIGLGKVFVVLPQGLIRGNFVGEGDVLNRLQHSIFQQIVTELRHRLTEAVHQPKSFLMSPRCNHRMSLC